MARTHQPTGMRSSALRSATPCFREANNWMSCMDHPKEMEGSSPRACNQRMGPKHHLPETRPQSPEAHDRMPFQHHPAEMRSSSSRIRYVSPEACNYQMAFKHPAETFPFSLAAHNHQMGLQHYPRDMWPFPPEARNHGMGVLHHPGETWPLATDASGACAARGGESTAGSAAARGREACDRCTGIETHVDTASDEDEVCAAKVCSVFS